MTDREGKEVSIEQPEVALFALIAEDLRALGQKHKKSLDDMHKLFYQTSCQRDRLVDCLEGKNAVVWNELEDLALKDPKQPAYKYVLDAKGQSEVDLRSQFLELN